MRYSYSLFQYFDCVYFFFFFFFKQKTAYEMRISDWSSDVCSSDLSMSYSIIGFGEVGQALARAFARKSIEVAVASRREPKMLASQASAIGTAEIGRASCRERVCQYV